MTGRSKQGQIIALRSTAGEDDLARLAAPDLSHPLPGRVEQRPSAPSDVMDAGRITVDIAQIGQHRFPHGEV